MFLSLLSLEVICARLDDFSKQVIQVRRPV